MEDPPALVQPGSNFFDDQRVDPSGVVKKGPVGDCAPVDEADCVPGALRGRLQAEVPSQSSLAACGGGGVVLPAIKLLVDPPAPIEPLSAYEG